MHTRAETERKYEAGSVADLPALDAVAGVTVSGVDTQTLEAVYFDTPGLRMARAGITLRSRTGGDDAGWHLKVPADGDTRDEMHMPLDAAAPDAPPARLLALTAGYTRGDEVCAVATVTTTRRRSELVDDGGTVLAHVTDDRVDATALPSDASGPTGVGPSSRWREVEVELAEDTDPELLDQVDEQLRRHGVRRAQHASKLARVLDVAAPRPLQPAATAGDAVLAYVRAQVARLLRYDLRTRRNDEDAVHQMRVTTRRLRSVLRVYGRVLDRGRTGRVADELKWLGQRLGPARDLEVMDAHERAEVEALPRELVVGPVSARLTRHFSTVETAARRGVERTLVSRRYLRLLDSLERVVADPPLTDRAHRPAAKELPRHVRRAYRKVARRVAAVDDTTDQPARDGALHSARKAAKRLRYGCEVAVPVVGR
ncbi:MAG: CYTH and CHAD domain-containing protein, partial [Streptosporangiales bacterium]|nr:CYTH and CHAD domain-containing protein [Streptosporangiales bacterium]